MKGSGFINDNFLLKNKSAEVLFHEYAQDLPILDYHNHLSPQMIAENYHFKDITEAWLGGDHYKWRAMRANGIDEKYITGQSAPSEKFAKWAMTVPMTARNPLYHWTHLELKRYFGVDALLNQENQSSVYNQCNEHLQKNDYRAQGLLHMMKVELVCTTDDPCDDLQYHKSHKDANGLKLRPTFRPDRFLQLSSPDFIHRLRELEEATHIDINTYDDLIIALERRVDFFMAHGCFIADHGLAHIPALLPNGKIDTIFENRLHSEILAPDDEAIFQINVLAELGRMYHKRNWTMQLHLGAIRNNNAKLMQSIGADVGCDSIGDYQQAEGLSILLNILDSSDQLPKTILYNLNPADNEVFATMAGNFNDGSSAGKIQWGSAWWFLDQKDGMEKQINTLSNMGLLSQFIGMLTDSRSFLSFPRHEYFRRILCQLIGQDVEDGLLPNDLPWLGNMVKDICYYNAKKFFEL